MEEKDELLKQREIISLIDKEMAELFEKRMKACAGIAAYKKERGLSVVDRSREDFLIENNRSYISDPAIESYYVEFLKGTIGLSRRYQERLLSGMKIAYSGVPGAFAYIAAKTMFDGASLQCKQSFDKAYQSVEAGECDCAVLPLENSYAGEVGAVMDLAFSGGLFINQVIELPVRHCLIGTENAVREEVKKVISHPQALHQCSDYIARHGFSTEEFGNTALAAQYVRDKDDPAVAAIASRETAELMGLKILDEQIQDSGVNTTRFASFSRTLRGQGEQTDGEDDSFILVCTVRNEAGSLAQALNIIGACGYNMKSVRSRPLKELLWKYYFFIEAEGNINTPDGQKMLSGLSGVCSDLRILGSYRAGKF